MAVDWANLDWETGASAGAAGTFQFVDLKDDDGTDLTDMVDQGKHYRSIEQLEADLREALNDPDVSVEEE